MQPILNLKRLPSPRRLGVQAILLPSPSLVCEGGTCRRMALRGCDPAAQNPLQARALRPDLDNIALKVAQARRVLLRKLSERPTVSLPEFSLKLQPTRRAEPPHREPPRADRSETHRHVRCRGRGSPQTRSLSTR